MRLDAAKYPSVSWEAMTFVTGKSDIHEVRLLDHANAASGAETAGTASLRISGSAPAWEIDTLHLLSATRVTRSPQRTWLSEKTQLAQDVQSGSGSQWVNVSDASGIQMGDWVSARWRARSVERPTLFGIRCE